MFNLLSRMNYFFEAESAEIVGIVLSAGRFGKVDVCDISNKCNITEASIIKFFDELCSIGLLVDKYITSSIIADYRKQCRDITSPPIKQTRTFELIQGGLQSACHAYAEAVKDCEVLFEVMFELTYRCREQCIHCYNPGATRNDDERNGRADMTELTLKDYQRIIDDLCANGLVVATITGGDPFSHPFAWQIIDYLYQQDIATSIYTNGLALVGKEQLLADYYPFIVQCSLYSDDPEVHDKITRTNGSWNHTVSVLDQLHQMSVPIDLACPIMQTNLKSYFGVKSYMHKYGSTIAFDVMLTDSLGGDKCVSKHLRLTPDQLSVVLLDKDVIQHVDVGEEDTFLISGRESLNGAPCGVLKNSFCINPNGDVTPCCTFHHVLGNLKQEDIKTVTESSEFIKQWIHTSEKDYKECYSHEYCHYCHFCPGNNYNDRRECLNGGENNCYLAKIRYNVTMRLQKGEDILQGKTLEERIKELDITEDFLKREYDIG